jgi:hypothetical protein
MADSVIGIVAEMVFTILQSAVDAIMSIGGLLARLLGTLGWVSGTGTTGFLVSVAVLGLILFFVGKFVLRSLKTIMILLVIGAALLAVLFLA